VCVCVCARVRRYTACKTFDAVGGLVCVCVCVRARACGDTPHAKSLEVVGGLVGGLKV
jgi:hypothetical protein